MHQAADQFGDPRRCRLLAVGADGEGRDAALQGRQGGIEGAGMMPTWQAATRGKYFSILIVDRITDTIIFESKKNSVIRQTWNIPTKGYVTGTIAFKGLLYGNNTEPPT